MWLLDCLKKSNSLSEEQTLGGALQGSHVPGDVQVRKLL